MPLLTLACRERIAWGLSGLHRHSVNRPVGSFISSEMKWPSGMLMSGFGLHKRELAMTNPYWHEAFKPHLTDRGEIRRLCFEIYNIVTASMSRQGAGSSEYEDPEYPEIDSLCFGMAEAELSKRLLRLALLVRAFDDTLKRAEDSAEYANRCKRIEEEHGDFGAVFEGPPDITKTIRECSNKIIHAEDVRPVYETQDDRDDPKVMWGMDGTIELEGLRGRDGWKIVIYLYPYLEGILELIKFKE
jgi:hypothetical protein